jgi:hypothetical protein
MSVHSPQEYVPPPGPAPLKWLMDRIQGQSKYGERGERPPCPCCWVPPPVGWFPGLLETNTFCKCWGGCGISNSEFLRFWCLNTAFLLNLSALFLTAYACLAISDDFLVLTKVAIHELTMTEVNGAWSDAILMFVGLRAAAIDNPVSGVGQVVVHFDQFCDLASDGIERYVDPNDCNACADVSANMVIALMISVATFLPTFFSEQLRMYSGYDVNCVKMYLTILGVITLLLNINVIVSFLTVCFPSFYDGTVLLDSQSNVLPPDTPEQESSYEVMFDWTWGYGLIILIVATGLKALDVLFNACIPTPNVTRDRREQDIYESIGVKDLERITEQTLPPGGSSVSTRETPRIILQEQERQSIVAQQVTQSMLQPQAVKEQSMTQSQQRQSQRPLQQNQSQQLYHQDEDYGRFGYPANPSIAYSSRYHEESEYRTGVQGLPGGPSVIYPGGPSLAPSATADPSPFPDPYA